MLRRSSNDYASEAELADRLALTTADRRLEARVVLQLIRSSATERAADADLADHPADDATYAHAVNIAAFLSMEYGFETLDHKVFVAELAAEMAQRIAEDIAGSSTLPDE